MRLRFLGTGTSFGIPVIGCSCAACTSADPRDKRSRHGALIQSDDAQTTILIDTPPELRLQLIAAGLSSIDAVAYTHEHADHINGIDDLRMFSVRRRRPLPVYGPRETLDRLRRSFDYIFDETVLPYEGTSKPALELHEVEPGRAVRMAGIEALPLSFRHGHLRVFGYRFGKLAYLTDVKAIPDAERERLQELEVLVVNALGWRPHPTHLSIAEAVETARALGARRTYLTHLTHETGHAELVVQLPEGVKPAYDGLTVEIPE
jgi:phosphoribosyl 1,2-cyclic phosphate phosphodiesterase